MLFILFNNGAYLDIKLYINPVSWRNVYLNNLHEWILSAFCMLCAHLSSLKQSGRFLHGTKRGRCCCRFNDITVAVCSSEHTAQLVKSRRLQHDYVIMIIFIKLSQILSISFTSQIPFGPYRRFQLESPHMYYMILGTCLLTYLLQFSRGDMKPWTVLKTPPQHYYAHSFLVKLCMLTTLKYYSVHSIVECCTNDIITRISIQTAGLAFGGTGLCSYRVRGVDGIGAEHLTVESYTVFISQHSQQSLRKVSFGWITHTNIKFIKNNQKVGWLPTVILTIIWYSITHSLFHSRLKTFLLCKSFPLQPFLSST